MTKLTSNIFVFTGADDFSLRQKINVWKTEFAKKFSATAIVELNNENLSEVDLGKKFEEVLTPSLFSQKKLIIARNCLPAKASQEVLIEILNTILKNIPNDYFLVFWQDSLDRRLGFIKNFVKTVNLVEFHLPHGQELNSWIRKQAAILGLTMESEAVEKLAVLSGRDLFEEKKAGGRVVERREFFDLWQIHSELEKLASFGQNPTAKDVGELVVARLPENVFALSDAIVAQNKKAALEVLENLYKSENTDEKSMAVKLVGLISEQIRSLLVVNTLRQQNMDQDQIATYLGWSPGRVFITLKHSANIKIDKLKTLLASLLAADVLVKSSETNPRLLIDLLITQ